MNVLLVHQNFPGQFKHLAPALVKRGDRVVALTINEPAAIAGVDTHRAVPQISTGSKLPWAQEFETKLIRGESAFRKALELRAAGFEPDVIMAHPGWGDTFFLKDVWPKARLAIYCEFFYKSDGGDADFDPEFLNSDDPIARNIRLKLKGLPQKLHFPMANRGLAPTEFQKSTYPSSFRDRITVIHDGIDTNAIRPRDNGRITFGDGRSVTRNDEIITFVARNLEPYRGYHIFMRALPALLRKRPNARVFIIGSNGTSYGALPPTGRNWRDIFLKEVRSELDMERVHFAGSLTYPVFLELLSISRLHIYLTYPFVLSWSLLEAMALGAPVLASDTAPLHEVIRHGENGLLFPFFDTEALAEEGARILADVALRRSLSKNARATAVEHYDLASVCLPQQLAFVDAVANDAALAPILENDR
ncbi:glycosyltransferase [Qipengyuania spongiae]|uniref:Glycosyltransferase n=1 Tax=Qipengyuania spongiae TaxID=2909673 RepID=A0ABY5T6A4_9SPHN|nr:glycosyltransferase [Qipengyuania spongiae]UVI40866.1 glycosyltransferase [Qipengyuania spongiae]